MISLLALKKAVVTKNLAAASEILKDYKDHTSKDYTIIVRLILNSDDLEALKLLVEHGLDLNEFRTTDDETLLSVACQARQNSPTSYEAHVALVKYLAEQCPEHINIMSPETYLTPLASVLCYSPYDTCKPLIQFFFDVGATIDQTLIAQISSYMSTMEYEQSDAFIHQRLLSLATDFAESKEKSELFTQLADSVKAILNIPDLSFAGKISLLQRLNRKSHTFSITMDAVEQEITADEDVFNLQSLYVICWQAKDSKRCKSILFAIKDMPFEDIVTFCEHIANRIYKMDGRHREVTRQFFENMYRTDEPIDVDEIIDYIGKYSRNYERLFALGCLDLCSHIEDLVWELGDIGKLSFIMGLGQCNYIHYYDNGETAKKLEKRYQQIAERLISSMKSNSFTEAYKEKTPEQLAEIIDSLKIILDGVAGAKEKVLAPLEKMRDKTKETPTGLLLFSFMGTEGLQPPAAENKMGPASINARNTIMSSLFG